MLACMEDLSHTPPTSIDRKVRTICVCHLRWLDVAGLEIKETGEGSKKDDFWYSVRLRSSSAQGALNMS